MLLSDIVTPVSVMGDMFSMYPTVLHMTAVWHWLEHLCDPRTSCLHNGWTVGLLIIE